MVILAVLAILAVINGGELVYVPGPVPPCLYTTRCTTVPHTDMAQRVHCLSAIGPVLALYPLQSPVLQME